MHSRFADTGAWLRLSRARLPAVRSGFSGGSLWTMGGNLRGQLATRSTDSRDAMTLVPLPAGRSAVGVWAMIRFTVVLLDDGGLWSESIIGSLLRLAGACCGQNSVMPACASIAVLSLPLHLSLRFAGQPSYGVGGFGVDSGSFPVLTRIPGPPNMQVVAVAADSHLAVLLVDGTLWVWIQSVTVG